MARIVVAGSGAIGASVAYHLALAGADDVVVAERGELAAARPRARWAAFASSSRPPPRSCSRVRASSSSRRSARGSSNRSAISSSRRPRTASRARGTARAAERARRSGRACRSHPSSPASPTRDILGATCCWLDGVADPPAVARELLRRASELGVEIREQCAAEEVDRDVLVIACGPWSPALAATVGVDLPIRPLCRQLLETSPLADLPDDLPMVIEVETGLPLPAPRRPSSPRDGRPGAALDVRDDRRRVARSPTGSSGSRAAIRPRPARRSTTPGRASTT